MDEIIVTNKYFNIFEKKNEKSNYGSSVVQPTIYGLIYGPGVGINKSVLSYLFLGNAACIFSILYGKHGLKYCIKLILISNILTSML